jgi:hypothetical protein
MRRLHGLALAPFAAGLLFFAATAEAQNKPAPPQGPSRSSSQYTLHRGEPGGGDASMARQRARSGDCAGALPGFDAAIRITIEPTLRRDRGLCHEKLGNPFPAIEDYRAYLTARPDAPDADQIRQRLSALEEQAGVGGPSSQSKKEEGGGGEPVEGEANAKMSIGGGGVAGTASSSSGKSSGSSRSDTLGPKQGEPERSYDYYAQQEKLAEAADTSPLRYGSGVVLGIYTMVPRFFVGRNAPDDFGYGVGGTLRYSTGPTLTLVSEFGYVGYGTQGSNTSASGPLVFGGVELRLPLNKFASDAVLLRGGIGFERYVVSGTRIGVNVWPARFALGYRHVFGPNVGLEILADGGPALFAPDPDGSENNVYGIVGASAAFVVGF